MATFVTDQSSMLRGDEDRWLAVLNRDRGRDGEFVFAVNSTGIYCRPSCPARRPRREHVRFFGGPAAAERAGFRPCRRCRPAAKTSAREDLAGQAAAWIDAHLEERITLPRLAEALGVSPGHLQRTFTRVTGVSPRAYAAARRLDAAKATMRAGADVTRAIHDAGYGSSSRFYDQARARLGMSPTSYRNGGAGRTISYATAASPLGQLLVAATDRGVCAVSVGDDDAVLVSALEAEFPRAVIQRDEPAMQPTLDAVLAHMHDHAAIATLPLDLTGTPFHHRVWQEPRSIPAGETRTYGQVVARIGQPGAARAVASACAANPAALVIPCHRVVRGNGTSGGYRWGRERKQALLEAEQGQARVSDASTD